MALCCNLFWASFSLGLVAFYFPEVGVRLLAAPGQVLDCILSCGCSFCHAWIPCFGCLVWVP